MGDKPEKIAGFREYLQETKAREKSKTLREYSERLLFEDRVRKTLEDLKGEGFLTQEGLVQITPWQKKLEGYEKPDFIVSKEDIVFQLYLLVDEKRAIIRRTFLRGLSDVLQANPRVTALIVVWNFEDLPSCALDSFILRKYMEKTDEQLDLSNEDISQLEVTIRDFYNDQFVAWLLPEDALIETEEETDVVNVTDMLQQRLIDAFREFERRRFTRPDKKEAQECILKMDKDRLLKKLTSLLTKSDLDKADFDELKSFLNRELKRVKSKDD